VYDSVVEVTTANS